MDKERCKATFFGTYRWQQCVRDATKDGYCWQHHPDEVEKRKKQVAKREEVKMKNSPYYKLKMARLELEEYHKVIDETGDGTLHNIQSMNKIKRIRRKYCK